MHANNLRRSHYIVAGKILKIPQRGYTKPKPAFKPPSDGQAVRHVVKKGDSLWIIARQYGTTTKMIRKRNGLKTTTLHKGQVLTIYPASPPRVAAAGLAVYEVKPGDSPFLIAKRHNMNLQRFLSLNQLWSGATIYPGQKVYVE
jgi:membrane-bound lytic murein transglycosylase D